jgi:hypothetical protein
MTRKEVERMKRYKIQKGKLKTPYILGILILRSFSIAKGIHAGKYCIYLIFADTDARKE